MRDLIQRIKTNCTRRKNLQQHDEITNKVIPSNKMENRRKKSESSRPKNTKRDGPISTHKQVVLTALSIRTVVRTTKIIPSIT